MKVYPTQPTCNQPNLGFSKKIPNFVEITDASHNSWNQSLNTSILTLNEALQREWSVGSKDLNSYIKNNLSPSFSPSSHSGWNVEDDDGDEDLWVKLDSRDEML